MNTFSPKLARLHIFGYSDADSGTCRTHRSAGRVPAIDKLPTTADQIILHRRHTEAYQDNSAAHKLAYP